MHEMHKEEGGRRGGDILYFIYIIIRDIYVYMFPYIFPYIYGKRERKVTHTSIC